MRVQFIDIIRGINQEVEVTADSIGVHLSGLALDETWLWNSIQIHSDESVLRFVGPQGASLEMPPTVLADALRGKRTLPAVNRRTPYRVVLGLLLACATVVFSSYFLLDKLSDQVAQKLPIRWEEEMGAQLNGRFVTQYCETPDQYETLRTLVRRLSGPPSPDSEIEVHISNERIDNAFSLPGGVIVVDTQLLHFMANSDELAGVLGHEIEHVLRRHVMRALVRGMLATSVWSLALGDYTGMLGVDPSTLYKVAHLKFDRDAEWDADQGAVRMLNAAHISPRGLADFFKRLAAESSGLRPSILTTHPSSARRMEYLESSIPPEASQWHEALPLEQWHLLQRGCVDGDELWRKTDRLPQPAAR